MLVSYQDLKVVHFELSENCNASCPMCPRTDNGGPVNPRLNGAQITLETIQNSFPPEIVKNLEAVHFCGNFGDPIAAKDSLEIVTYFRTNNQKIRIMFNTNGGARTPQWWAKLGEQMREEESVVVFGIDGLESTNHIYRRNVKWDKLMANAKAFIDAGGRARWEYLVFKHNQHQCKEAEELSVRMGFAEFHLKKTARFFDFDQGKIVSFPVFNEKCETESFLEPPDDDQMKNPVSIKLETQTVPDEPVEPAAPPRRKWWKIRYKSWLLGEVKRHARERWEDISVKIKRPRVSPDLNCIHANEKSVYVSARGEVLPCCFWGGQIRYTYPGEDGEKIDTMAQTSVGGLEETSLRKYTLKELMAGKWFRAVDISLSVPQDSRYRVGTCGRLCTRQSEIVKSEFY